jgi:2-oxoglutarate dehydrogenase E2 component (dihydrolipoamide succinyltransferase)
MARFELTLPAMGEGIIEAAITRWFVTKGQQVKIDQPLLEVATDKVDSEIPSPVEGTILKLVYNEGEIPRVGEVIALIETEIASPDLLSSEPLETEVEKSKNSKVVSEEFNIPALTDMPELNLDEKPSEIFISPLIRTLARQRGITSDELEQIRGTGLNGRITKEDINNYIISGRPAFNKGDILSDRHEQQETQNQSMPDILPESEDEVVEMDRMRRLIAGHMIRSKRIAPHVTSFLEADITVLAAWRKKVKNDFLTRENANLTFTPLFVEAVALALKEFPRINVSVSRDSIIIRKNINIGIATALPIGNLIVPVIRNADRENLGGIARKVADLAERARNNALLPSEIKGGTFTITNIGLYNNLTGTPIINQPESAILAVGTIAKKPWAVKTPEGYGLAIRDITMLSLTYDHRVIDGALGGGFLSRVVWYLENFDSTREV